LYEFIFKKQGVTATINTGDVAMGDTTKLGLAREKKH
jgi:hypothetical protein